MLTPPKLRMNNAKDRALRDPEADETHFPEAPSEVWMQQLEHAISPLDPEYILESLGYFSDRDLFSMAVRNCLSLVSIRSGTEFIFGTLPGFHRR